MKHTKKYLAVLMAISILLCSVIAITSSAADSSKGDNEAELEELQPVMATECIYYPSKFVGAPDSSVIEYNSYGDKYVIMFGHDGYAQYYIHYSTHGVPGYHENPHYHTFGVVNGSWTPIGNNPGLPLQN